MPFLLERLASPARSVDGNAGTFDEAAAVGAQIQRIMASRTVLQGGGAGAVVPWGMQNVTELTCHSEVALVQFAEQARRLIAKHEPRIAQLRVSVQPQEDVLNPYRLVVSGTLSKIPYESSLSLAG